MARDIIGMWKELTNREPLGTHFDGILRYKNKIRQKVNSELEYKQEIKTNNK